LGSAMTGSNQGVIRNIADVFGTAAGTLTALYGGSGRNSFSIAPFDGGSLDDGNGIRGLLYVFGGGNPNDSLTYYDFVNPMPSQTYTMSVIPDTGFWGQIVDNGFSTVTYDNRIFAAGLVTTEHGSSTVNILSTAVPTQVQAGTGDSVIVGNPVTGGRTLADIAGFLNIFSVD